MRRRLNYTGRTKLLEKDVRIAVMCPEPGRKDFVADLDLKEYEFDLGASVWVEAYDRDTVLRFGFGTVENPRSEGPCAIDNFASTDAFHFRVKVVDPKKHNVLLGIAKSINPAKAEEDNAPAHALLRLDRKDLSGRPWKIEFPPGQYPILYIDVSIDEGTSLARSNPFFQGAVFPQILENILNEILVGEDFRPSEEIEAEDMWKQGWIEFAEALPGVAALELDRDCSDEELANWVDSAVEAFAKQFHAIKKIRIALKEIEA